MCACKSTRIFSLLWKSNRIVAVDCVHTDFKRRCSSTFFLFICCARDWPWIMWPGPTQFNASSISFYSASALNTLSPFDELPVKHKRYHITAERVAFQTIWNVHSNYNKMVAFICYRVAVNRIPVAKRIAFFKTFWSILFVFVFLYLSIIKSSYCNFAYTSQQTCPLKSLQANVQNQVMKSISFCSTPNHFFFFK